MLITFLNLRSNLLVFHVTGCNALGGTTQSVSELNPNASSKSTLAACESHPNSNCVHVRILVLTVSDTNFEY